VIRLQNIGEGFFKGDDQAFISKKHFEMLRRHDARPGDVLIAALGDILPRACLVPEGIGPAIVKADCFRFRPAHGVNARLVQHLMNSPQVREAAAHLISGVGRPRLNLGKVGNIQIPLPPAPEQNRIVAAIEEQFSRVDAGVAALGRVRQNLERMRAAMLHAAVTGHLVTQDANDESAMRLIERRSRERVGLGSRSPQQPDPDKSMAALVLPDTWVWVTIGQLFDVFVGATPSSTAAVLRVVTCG